MLSNMIKDLTIIEETVPDDIENTADQIDTVKVVDYVRNSLNKNNLQCYFFSYSTSSALSSSKHFIPAETEKKSITNCFACLKEEVTLLFMGCSKNIRNQFQQ